MPVAIPCGHASVLEPPDDIFKSPAADQPVAALQQLRDAVAMGQPRPGSPFAQDENR